MKKTKTKKTNKLIGKEKKSMKESVDIIITAFNNKKIIGKCLESVKRQSYKNFKCIVVDDNSNDGTPELISGRYKWVRLIRKKKQTGPSISRNIGIRHGHAEYIATLDSDVVLDKNWLKEQVQFMEKCESNGERCSILASKMLFANNHKIINSAGGSLRFPGIGHDIGSGKKDSFQYNQVREVHYACSGAMMIHRSMINKIGMFDETYFYGHEDTDLGWRARLAGYRVFYNPKAVAYHDVNQTVKTMSEKVVFHGTKNRIRSIIKNCNFLAMPFNLSAYFMITISQIVLMPYRMARTRAWWWNLKNISDTAGKRRQWQKSS